MKDQKFLAEVVKDLGPKPRMLVVLFAQPREDWEAKFAQYQPEMKSRVPRGVTLHFELAFPDIFEEQIKRSDIVFIYGGDDHLVTYWLKQFDLPKIWEGQVVATSSAGSDVLAAHYWTCDWRQCMDGLGIVSIKFLGHFRSDYGSTDSRGPVDWDAGYAALAEYGDKNLPIHALEEGDFVVVEA